MCVCPNKVMFRSPMNMFFFIVLSSNVGRKGKVKKRKGEVEGKGGSIGGKRD